MPYEILPAEEYWSAIEIAENGTESSQEESGAASSAGSIIVILPGSADHPDSQDNPASDKAQQPSHDYGTGQQTRPQNMDKSSEPYESSLPLVSTAQPTIQPEPTVTPAPTPRVGKTGVDLDACKAQNDDFVAWLKIPGTKINYPVVWTDNVDYYLTHTFSGKESKVGTLF
ncbi:MAG: class B sortase, partial [Clostridia bacterium]|nr:class B sortase [Clostridia bacterium]